MNSSINDSWTHNKIKAILNHYGHKFFHGKKILDLGCGTGDVAAAFSRLGATVICADARIENLNILIKKHPFLKTIKIDLDHEWNFDRNFDIVLSLGLICHIKDFNKHIEQICNTAEHIILETEVLDSSDPSIKLPIFEDKKVEHLSFNGEGNLVSSSAIQTKLSQLNATYKRVDDSKLNSFPYIYDWKETNSNTRKMGSRRLWFIKRDRYIVQKIEAQKQIQKVEATIISQPKPIINEIQPIEQKIIEEAPKREIFEFKKTSRQNLNELNQTSQNKRGVALCLYGDYDKLDIISFKNNFDIFIYLSNHNEEFVNQLKSLPNVINIKINNFDGSKIEKDLYAIKQVNIMRELYEQKHNSKYDLIITKHINDIAKENMENLNTYYSSNDIFVANSTVSDAAAVIFDFIKLYKKETFSDLFKFHIKQLNLPINIK